jgi:hypothetical protein
MKKKKNNENKETILRMIYFVSLSYRKFVKKKSKELLKMFEVVYGEF